MCALDFAPIACAIAQSPYVARDVQSQLPLHKFAVDSELLPLFGNRKFYNDFAVYLVYISCAPDVLDNYRILNGRAGGA